jgi:hypothetical protein
MRRRWIWVSAGIAAALILAVATLVSHHGNRNRLRNHLDLLRRDRRNKSECQRFSAGARRKTGGREGTRMKKIFCPSLLAIPLLAQRPLPVDGEVGVRITPQISGAPNRNRSASQLQETRTVPSASYTTFREIPFSRMKSKSRPPAAELIRSRQSPPARSSPDLSKTAVCPGSTRRPWFRRLTRPAR